MKYRRNTKRRFCALKCKCYLSLYGIHVLEMYSLKCIRYWPTLWNLTNISTTGISVHSINWGNNRTWINHFPHRILPSTSPYWEALYITVLYAYQEQYLPILLTSGFFNKYCTSRKLLYSELVLDTLGTCPTTGCKTSVTFVTHMLLGNLSQYLAYIQ